MQYAPMTRLWTDDLMIFTNGGPVSDADAVNLERNGIRFATDRIEFLHSSDGRLSSVELETGEHIERDAEFLSDDYSEPTTTFAEAIVHDIATERWSNR